MIRSFSDDIIEFGFALQAAYGVTVNHHHPSQFKLLCALSVLEKCSIFCS